MFGQIKQPAFLYSVSLYSSAPSPFSQLLFVRTVLETPHTRAPVNGAERLPGEDGGTQLAEAKMKQTNTKRRPGRGGAPSTTTPKHRSPPESGVGGGTVEIHEEGICLPRPARSLGSRIPENKKKTNITAYTFFHNYCFLRDPKVSFWLRPPRQVSRAQGGGSGASCWRCLALPACFFRGGGGRR